MNEVSLERASSRPTGFDDHRGVAASSPSMPFTAAAGLRRLAILHAAEPTATFLAALRADPLRHGFGFMLDRDDALQAIALIDEVVSDLPDPVADEAVAPLRADYVAIHHALDYGTPPTESAWTAKPGQPAPDDPVAALGRWRQRAGLPPDRTRPADHLVPQLTLLAALLERGQAPDATLFLDQHPLRWVPAFCSRVATRCREPFYAGVAILTASCLDHLRDLLAGACDLPRPSDEGDDTRRRRWTEGRVPRICGSDA